MADPTLASKSFASLRLRLIQAKKRRDDRVPLSLSEAALRPLIEENRLRVVKSEGSGAPVTLHPLYGALPGSRAGNRQNTVRIEPLMGGYLEI